ncbi:S1 RNA-binding domain-containing protein [Halomonas sp. M20]|uniref:CvfB family protein n=1 Tax=Halomonas sp. M20 TaxID=2763264 RepID=UPI001D0B1A6B|nr:S1-like domain-containing RNA-binding protein [Halomonas sp. M20]
MPRDHFFQPTIGDVALLEVVAIKDAGAFLGWGRPKDLLLPYSEQRSRPRVGQQVLVMIFEDDQGRPAASMRLEDFIIDQAEGLKNGDKVALVIGERTDLGVKAVVNQRFWGLLYHDELTRPPKRGERMEGYVRRVREDGRLDLSLLPSGAEKQQLAAERIIDALQANQGFLALSDKSSPATIKSQLGISKSAFKQAIGKLYKQRRIVIEAKGIRLARSE